MLVSQPVWNFAGDGAGLLRDSCGTGDIRILRDVSNACLSCHCSLSELVLSVGTISIWGQVIQRDRALCHIYVAIYFKFLMNFFMTQSRRIVMFVWKINLRIFVRSIKNCLHSFTGGNDKMFPLIFGQIISSKSQSWSQLSSLPIVIAFLSVLTFASDNFPK